MRIRYWIGALLCILLLCCAVASQAAPRAAMPPGSFLTKSVSNPEDLAKQIEQDKRVASRFSRHFGMPVNELAEYVRKNLRMSQLKSSGKYTTYFITKGDRILVHTKSFKAGRKVFETPDGRPVLDAACGNPLTRSLPKIVAKVEAEQVVVEKPVAPPPPPVQETPPMVVELPVTPPEVETPVEEAPQMAQELNTPPPEVAVLDMPPTEFTSAASLLTRAILPGLLTAGAASAVFGGKGGGGETVPEPSGLIVLGSSAVALCAGFRIRRRIGRTDSAER